MNDAELIARARKALDVPVSIMGGEIFVIEPGLVRELADALARHSAPLSVTEQPSWASISKVAPLLGLPGDRHSAPLPEGDGEPCYYCKEPCSAIAGNPGRWPVALCHRDDPGVVKWHHEQCVSQRLKGE